MTEKIFIVGCERSGTSLLREVLNRSDRVCIALETHFLRRFSRTGKARRLERFGDLRDDANVERLAAALLAGRRALGSSYWGWLADEVTEETFRDRILRTDRTERSLFTVLMELYAERTCGASTGDGSMGDVILGEKTPSHLYYVPTLLEWFPGARVVHTFRDPRSIVVSKLLKVRKTMEGPKVRFSYLPSWMIRILETPIEVLHITKSWLDATRLHRRYARAYPGRYHMVRFEDLVTDPEGRVKEICDFLRLPFERRMLEEVPVMGSSYAPEGRRRSGFDTRAIDRWREHIHPVVSAWFSVVFRGPLRGLGYAGAMPWPAETAPAVAGPALSPLGASALERDGSGPSAAADPVSALPLDPSPRVASALPEEPPPAAPAP